MDSLIVNDSIGSKIKRPTRFLHYLDLSNLHLQLNDLFYGVFGAKSITLLSIFNMTYSMSDTADTSGWLVLPPL
jgi:hypothetical protein